MANKRDYYEVLGVQKDAAPDEIKRAYRKLAAANHPDRNKGDEAALERFKEAASAFEVLGDEEKREIYDRYGHEGLERRGGGPQFQNAADIFGAFGDIFGELFGGGGGGGAAAANRPRRGDSLRYPVQLDLKEAFLGCKRSVSFERDEICKTCTGNGAKPGTKPEFCSTCAGLGVVNQTRSGFGFQFQQRAACPACRGAGSIIREKCPDCRGAGRKAEPVTIEVAIPAGVDTGMQVVRQGEGEPGANGGPRGDLHCEIVVKEHPLFKREGTHLTCRVPVTFSQAALGAEFDLPMLVGTELLKIPAGTQPGEVLRKRGLGMPDHRTQRRGDLLVEIQVEVPKKLNEKQEQLIRELASLDQTHVSSHRKSFLEKLKDLFAPITGADEDPKS